MAEMKAGQAGLDYKMEAEHEKMEQVQEQMKNLILAERKEMKAYVESQVEGMKEHVDRSIGKIEEDVQGVEEHIG
ncbi:hypothetical protein AVEN_154970-1 [Araneus ventricosus]|uniref:Uncharacterized protein n=1 Tax=Araneus ventricosus TaxID=182803 RepID=A0A4Y2A8J9_ARAVE|nr:hypothetical protein AVEN_154970-1 [Araneus ventricosus]